MYLKALELQGFKSFPEKTVISFDQEVTAIVGPNGSGKSNISDALLWVMGEQRARAFRGTKMEDVIFGGTEKRGSMGFAQVSLILDNTARTFNIDSDELKITRRYYRNGDSEYSINRESVRLRDIQEILMDTGLGRDGYSIIGQGRISEVVSAKSTDRRELFEEAAGIARFRHRKEETERQLAKTEENLVRINDRIDELKPQIEPLKKQAETAKKYLILRDELREVEISLWLENIEQLQKKAESIRVEYEANVLLRDTAQNEINALYAASDSLSERAHEIELQAESKREELRGAEAEVAECDREAAVKRTNIQNNEDTLSRLQQELSSDNERTSALNIQIEDHRSRIDEIDEERLRLDVQERELLLKTSETESGLNNHSAKLSAMVAQENELNVQLSQIVTQTQFLEENLSLFRRKSENSSQEREEAELKQKLAKETRKKALKALHEAEMNVTKTANMVTGRSMLLSGRERDCTELAEQRNKLNAQLNGAESRLSLLREMEKDMRGFGEGSKAVMRESSHGVLKGIHGPLSRLIYTEERYTLAVETALGQAFQNIVVETQIDAKNALDYLKINNAGRTTFLPIDRIKSRKLKNEPVKEEGYIGICSELVSCDSRYRPIVEDQLGMTVVAETMQDAIRISDRNGQNLRIVTLDGQLINPRGSMTGGSAVKTAGFLSRANEIEKLTNDISKLQQKIKDVSAKSYEADRKLEQLRIELDDAKENNARARQELSRQEGLCAQADLLYETATSALNDFENSQLQLQEDIVSCSSRISELKGKENECLDKISALQIQMNSESNGAGELEQLRRELNDELSTLRTKDAALVSEKQTAVMAVEQLEELRKRMVDEKDQREDALGTAKKLHDELQKELDTIENRRGFIITRVEITRKNIDSLTENKLSLEQKRTSNDKLIQAKSAELMDSTSRCASLEQKKVASELEEKQLIDKLWDTYELSRSAAQELRKPIENLAKANRHAMELRRTISSLGTPNLGAIEEYGRVNERYELLTTQSDDVLKAKAELSKLIAEYTAQMETNFVREFNAISEAFRETFLEMFGGGKAKLSLEDENDVLNCGIDIRIQPPGKALSNISLLSGGEKAFVAIALYFAIMKVRPTPFCIMDEIESALDEANVSIFADYLHRLSHNTQFIVITHRRGTMESADELYGVTMQEKGVSTILSVNIAEAEKTIH